MRLVLDTNVLLAAFIARGVCDELLEHCERNHQLVSSEFILEEFREKLVRKFNVPTSKAREAAALLHSQMDLVDPIPLKPPVCRDPDDDWVLVTAVACGRIITGDKDLLSLEEYRDIRILAPGAFWSYEASHQDLVLRSSKVVNKGTPPMPLGPVLCTHQLGRVFYARIEERSTSLTNRLADGRDAGSTHDTWISK